MWNITENFLKADMEETSLVLGGGVPQYLYFGKKIKTQGEYAILQPETDFGGNRIPLTPLSSFGDGDFREPYFLAEYPCGAFASRFRFVGAEKCEKPDLAPLPSSRGKGETAKLIYRDDASGLEIGQYYTVYEGCDVVAVSSEVINRGKEAIKIRKLSSLQFELWGNDDTFITFDGGWGFERQKHETKLKAGLCVNDSKTGSSSPFHNPFVMLKGKRGVYGFNLVYSGNHKESVECDELGRTRFLTGINDFMFSWNLAPEEKFVSPEAVMTWGETEDEVSAHMHDFVQKHILNGKWKDRERPVLVNNWEGTEFHFDEEKIKAIVDRAAEVGAELFVLDDGWFGHRDSDRSSLGDWFDYASKTGGIARLADYARAKGLDFGIWMEPEMISEDSELYRAHPEYAMKPEGREPFRIRNQLMLDLVNEEVQSYIYNAVAGVIRLCKASYVKWDYNRFMTDCYSPSVAAGEYYHRYILGLYRVLDKLVKEFPDVLFESCASGGGRYDLGMFCFMPQTWVSDDTDARERLYIQSGTSYAYPVNTFGSHVSSSPNLQSGNLSPLETRFNVACCGNLGYEMDMTKCSEEELQTIKRQIAFYKEHRRTFQYGKFYRIGDAFKDNVAGFSFVSNEEAIAVVCVKEKRVGIKNHRFSLKGLDEDEIYEVSSRLQENYPKPVSYLAGGDVLMNGSLVLDGIFDDTDPAARANPVYTRMFILKKVANIS